MSDLSRVEAILASKQPGAAPYTDEPLSRLEQELLNADFSKPTKVVNSFSEMTEEGQTYAIRNTEEGEYNSYTEYILVNGKPERYGKQDTVVDAYTRAEADSLLDEKVDKVTGKGLSTNDYTTSEKEKLAGIEAGAQKNPTLAAVATSGSYNDLSDKPVIPSSSSAEPVAYTILVSGWNNKVYSFESDYPSSTYDITDILIKDDATATARKQWDEAAVNGYKSANVIVSHGKQPKMDLPVVLMVKEKEIT